MLQICKLGYNRKLFVFMLHRVRHGVIVYLLKLVTLYTQAKLDGYRGERLKRKAPAEAAAQEDLQVTRTKLFLLEVSHADGQF